MLTRGDLSGGFAGTNTGTITDCYCIYKASRKNSKRGFCGKNTGEIRTSFANYKGDMIELYNSKGNSTDKVIRKASDAAFLGFDVEHTWSYSDDKYRLRFIDDRWHTDDKKPADAKPILIKSVEAFFKFISAVNDGDDRLIGAYIKVAADIDCGGRTITPIGSSFQSGFKGVFDGDSHTISNFKIVGKEIGNYGLFGCLRGAVINLSVDGKVRGEGNVGSLCGHNFGYISCCGAVTVVRGSGDKLHMGGLVGYNEGEVEKSYVAVSVHGAIVPVIPIGMVAAGASLVGTVGFMAIPATEAIDQIYAPVKPDEHQIIIDKEEAPPGNGAANTLAFGFNETLHVNSDTGDVYINLTNPSYSTHKFVATLETADGGVVMAESGAIEPGHGLESMHLTGDGYDAINSGVRDGMVVLTPYDAVDDSKSMVDSKLPVTIVIE